MWKPNWPSLQHASKYLEYENPNFFLLLKSKVARQWKNFWVLLF